MLLMKWGLQRAVPSPSLHTRFHPRKSVLSGLPADPSPQLGDSAVFLKELAQIRKEEKEKKRRRLENINSLKGMGYSTHAAKQALHQASGNLDEALKVGDPGPLSLPRPPLSILPLVPRPPRPPLP